MALEGRDGPPAKPAAGSPPWIADTKWPRERSLRLIPRGTQGVRGLVASLSSVMSHWPCNRSSACMFSASRRSAMTPRSSGRRLSAQCIAISSTWWHKGGPKASFHQWQPLVGCSVTNSTIRAPAGRCDLLGRRLALPGGLRPPVDVIGALGPGYEEVLTEDQMVKDDDELKDAWQQPRPGSYLGETFRAGATKYDAFLKELVSIGLVGRFGAKSVAPPPFFVEEILQVTSHLGLQARQRVLQVFRGLREVERREPPRIVAARLDLGIAPRRLLGRPVCEGRLQVHGGVRSLRSPRALPGTLGPQWGGTTMGRKSFERLPSCCPGAHPLSHALGLDRRDRHDVDGPGPPRRRSRSSWSLCAT